MERVLWITYAWADNVEGDFDYLVTKLKAAGVLAQVPVKDIPPALAVRLCVDLRYPTWTEQIKAGIENRPPTRHTEPSPNFRIRRFREPLSSQYGIRLRTRALRSAV